MLKHVIKENVTLVYSLPRIHLRYKLSFSGGRRLQHMPLRQASRLPLISVQTAMTMARTDNFHVFLFFVCFDIGSHEAQAGLELLIFLYWPSKCGVRSVKEEDKDRPDRPYFHKANIPLTKIKIKAETLV